ncbi:MAG: hypothetical protein ACXVY6_11355 [Gaiellaceae bacterium]
MLAGLSASRDNQVLADGLELEQSPQALMLFGARGAAGEMRVQAGYGRVRVCARKLELDVAIELVEALVAAELTFSWAEEPEQHQAEIPVRHYQPPLKPADCRWARSFCRASWRDL